MATLREETLKDKRYEINLEWCGYSKPQHVVRFCGSWVDCSPTHSGAQTLAVNHNARRIGVL